MAANLYSIWIVLENLPCNNIQLHNFLIIQHPLNNTNATDTSPCKNMSPTLNCSVSNSYHNKALYLKVFLLSQEMHYQEKKVLGWTECFKSFREYRNFSSLGYSSPPVRPSLAGVIATPVEQIGVLTVTSR